MSSINNIYLFIFVVNVDVDIKSICAYIFILSHSIFHPVKGKLFFRVQ